MSGHSDHLANVETLTTRVINVILRLKNVNLCGDGQMRDRRSCFSSC